MKNKDHTNYFNKIFNQLTIYEIDGEHIEVLYDKYGFSKSNDLINEKYNKINNE